jgi:hypothetical protein
VSSSARWSPGAERRRDQKRSDWLLRVLEAVQRTLATRHTASAVVRFNGREYRMRGA